MYATKNVTLDTSISQQDVEDEDSDEEDEDSLGVKNYNFIEITTKGLRTIMTVPLELYSLGPTK